MFSCSWIWVPKFYLRFPAASAEGKRLTPTGEFISGYGITDGKTEIIELTIAGNSNKK